MFKEKYDSLLKSKVFSEFSEKHPSAYFVHAFYLQDDLNKDSIHLGFYDSEEDRLFTFVYDKEELSIRAEKEIFREESKKLVQVDMSKVALDIDDASRLVDEFQKKQYPNIKPFKKIFILQSLPIGQVWNVTFVLQDFKTLNIKMDSSTGEVLEHNLLSIISMDKKE